MILAERRLQERRANLADTMERRRQSDLQDQPAPLGEALEVIPNADLPPAPAAAKPPANLPQAESPMVIVTRV
jgi:hypothetical protein